MSEKQTIPLLGGLLAGIAASLCCAGPLVVLLLGFGGAWVSNLTALEPYRPIFIAVALIALAVAYWQIYRPAVNQPCEEGKACANLPVRQRNKMIFWGVTIIVIIAIMSPYLLAFSYGQ